MSKFSDGEYNAGPKASFYLSVGDSLKEECVHGIVFRLINDDIVSLNGYVWNYVSNDNKIFKWSSKNYNYQAVRALSVSRIEDTVVSNTIWYNLDSGEFKNLSIDELKTRAIKKFIEKFQEDYKKLETKITNVSRNIRLLEKSINK